MSYAVNLFPDSSDPAAYCDTLAQLVFVGARELTSLSSNDKRVQYDEWSQAVRTDAGCSGINISADQLDWLWESLRSEPNLRSRSFPIVRVLPKGSRLELRLRHISTGYGDSSSLPLMPEPEAEVTIDDDLMMSLGKKNHFQCQSVSAKLTMKIHSGIGDTKAEAAKMKAKPDTVTVDGNRVIVKVGSLNQAYTKASLRLEPDRQSHGGRVYDVLFWRDSKNNEVSLGDIRDYVECEAWVVPQSSTTVEEQ